MTRTLREVLELGAPNSFRRGRVTGHAHDIVRDGKSVGTAVLTRHEREPHHVHVANVWSREFRRGQFGHSETRSLLRSVRKHYPDAKTIGGFRMTGARAHAPGGLDHNKRDAPTGEENARMRIPEELELSEPDVQRRHHARLTNYAHRITRDGESVGQATLTRHDDEPDHLHVGHVASTGSRLHDFGHSDTRSLLRAVRRAHPWARTIGGYRVTGARYDSGAVFDKSRVANKPAGEENMRMRLPESFREFLEARGELSALAGSIRPTRLARSERYADSREASDEFERRGGHLHPDARDVSVHPSSLRATQAWVDSRWSGGERKTPMAGLRTRDGSVHLVDGHHRGDALHDGTRPVTVRVHDVE